MTETNTNTTSYGINDTSSPVALNQPTDCPTNFIPVPGSATYATAGFCVMKYEAKIQGNNNGNQTYNSAFVPESRIAGTPWVNISQTNAIAEAQTVPNCTSCHLITLTLTNGQVIWDIAGNVWERTSEQTTGGQPGILGSGFGWREWTAPTTHGTLSTDPFPSSTGIAGSSTWTTTQGIGWIYSSTDDVGPRGFIRGGYWHHSSDASVLTLYLSVVPSSYVGSDVSFRVSR